MALLISLRWSFCEPNPTLSFLTDTVISILFPPTLPLISIRLHSILKASILLASLTGLDRTSPRDFSDRSLFSLIIFIPAGVKVLSDHHDSSLFSSLFPPGETACEMGEIARAIAAWA